LLDQAEATKYLICPNLDVTPNGRSKLSRTDNKKGLLIQDTINKSIDVDNNPHLVLSVKPFKRLYVEVPAAPNNNAYTVVNRYTLYGSRLG